MVNRPFKSLKKFGNKYFIDSFYPKKKEVMKYNKNHLAIGRKLDGKIYYLDLSEAVRIIMIGATRSGKTFFTRSIVDRLILTKRDVIYLTDIKDEFKSSREELQEKFHHLILPIEEPKKTKVVTLRPTFFKSINSTLSENNFWYSIDIRKLTRADFMTLVKFQELSSAQKPLMDMVYSELMRRLNSDPELKFDLKLINLIIDQIEGIDDRQKNPLKIRFAPLEHANFHNPEHEKSVVDLIQRGYVPAINYDGFDNFGKGSFMFPEVTLGIVLREVIDARKSKKIKTLWVIMDECLRFIGKDKDTSVKKDVLESVDLHTAAGVNYIFVAQVVSKLPEQITKQGRYLFIPNTCDPDTIKDALKSMGLYKYQQTVGNEALVLKRKMMKHKHSWVIFDRTTGTGDVVLPLAPLSNHMETTK